MLERLHDGLDLEGDNRIDEEGLPMAIYEIANLNKLDSGLPVNCWIDEAGWYKNSQHPNSPRIKAQNNYGGTFQDKDVFSITIPINAENEPEITSSKQIRIKDSDVNLIKEFVKNIGRNY